MLIYVGLASLWNLLAGYGGLVSVGQQAYVGLGAYLLFAGGILLGVPPLAAVSHRGGRSPRILALPVSVLVFRLRGAYFAIGTWVVAEVFRLLAAQMTRSGRRFGSQPADRDRQVDRLDSRETPRIRDLRSDARRATLLILAGIFLIARSRWGLGAAGDPRQ